MPCEFLVCSASARELPREVLGSSWIDIVSLKASHAKGLTNCRVDNVIREILGMELLKGRVSFLLVLELLSNMLKSLSVIRVRLVKSS